MARITFEQMVKMLKEKKIQQEREQYKSQIEKGNKNRVRVKLKKKYPNGIVSNGMTIEAFIESLEKEIKD